jgi:fructosamine-3-kinase
MTAFVKEDATAPPDFFAVEAEGLAWLAEAAGSGGPAVPRVLSVSTARIEVELIDTGPWTAAADEEFGRALAALHHAGAPHFGWHRDGYIGPLRMPNTPAPDWPSFYVTCRVQPFLRLAVERRAIDAAGASAIEQAAARVADLAGPPEPPSRLHGDLWRGNVLADREGRPWVVDPAAHGGHRETDLAMMALFGGFGDRCFAAYDEAFPRSEGWRDRVPLQQLHPLLVHAALFGGGYGAQAVAAARRYTR